MDGDVEGSSVVTLLGRGGKECQFHLGHVELRFTCGIRRNIKVVGIQEVQMMEVKVMSDLNLTVDPWV